MSALPVLGIDPGHDGAAVLLGSDGRTVLGWWAWHRLARAAIRGGRHAWIVGSGGQGLVEGCVPTLGGVGLVVLGGVAASGIGGYVLVVEGLFGRGPTLAALAESAALVYGPLQAGAVNDLADYRPRSATWRMEILGVNERSMGADAAEGASIRLVPVRSTLRREDLVGPHAGHLAEAVCIAQWGALMRRREQGACRGLV